PANSKDAEYHRRLGTIYMLLGHLDRAESEFDLAIETYERQLDSVSRPEGKAQLIWLIAQTLADQGDLEAALEKAKQAEAMSTSAKLNWKISLWRSGLVMK
ncbi:MAG: tetratricopeptide repeat protein, partial [Deltaproteobacteria bacterium]|nr:tetratricopeptide repeat protein [Deltaproteobacteria bacterium]